MAEEIIVVRRRDPIEVAVYGIMFAAVAIFFLLKWLMQFLMKWSILPAPYNLVAGFYYYTVAVPVHSFQFVWYTVNYNTIIPYPNINLILAWLAVIIYAVIVLKLISIGLSKLYNFGIKPRTVIKTFFAPLLFAALWALGVLIFEWLFSK